MSGPFWFNREYRAKRACERTLQKPPSSLDAKIAETLMDMPANLVWQISPPKRTWLLCHVWYFHLIHRFIISLGPLSSYPLSFQVVEVSYIPSHCIGTSSLSSAEVFTDRPFDQASKINNALTENSNSLSLSIDNGIKASHRKHF